MSDFTRTIDFLKALGFDSTTDVYFNVTYTSPDLSSTTYGLLLPPTPETMARLSEENQRGCNIFFSIERGNPTQVSTLWAHLHSSDFDKVDVGAGMELARGRITDHDRFPSFIVSARDALQVYYVLDEPVTLADDASIQDFETRLRDLTTELGGNPRKHPLRRGSALPGFAYWEAPDPVRISLANGGWRE